MEPSENCGGYFLNTWTSTGLLNTALKNDGTISFILASQNPPSLCSGISKGFTNACAKVFISVSMEQCTGIALYTAIFGDINFNEIAEDAIDNAYKRRVTLTPLSPFILRKTSLDSWLWPHCFELECRLCTFKHLSLYIDTISPFPTIPKCEHHARNVESIKF